MTINRNKSNTGDGMGRSCSQNEGKEKDRSFVDLIFYFFVGAACTTAVGDSYSSSSSSTFGLGAVARACATTAVGDSYSLSNTDGARGFGKAGTVAAAVAVAGTGFGAVPVFDKIYSSATAVATAVGVLNSSPSSS